MARSATSMQAFGISELGIMLRTLPDKVGKTILKDGMKLTAEEVRSEVVRRTPKRTGRLREEMAKVSIKARAARDLIVAGVPFPTRDALDIEADDPHFWPSAVEHGHGHVPPNPFVRPAVDENVERYTRKLARDIGPPIEREARRLARGRGRRR